ncbi:unnamed protein product [Closterium sp. NIES-54]
MLLPLPPRSLRILPSLLLPSLLLPSLLVPSLHSSRLLHHLPPLSPLFPHVSYAFLRQPPPPFPLYSRSLLALLPLLPPPHFPRYATEPQSQPPVLVRH